MRKKIILSKFLRTVVPFLLLLGVVYLVSVECATSPMVPTSNGVLSGIVWLDSIPKVPVGLHIHGRDTTSHNNSAWNRLINQDSIPMIFALLESHFFHNGKDYYGKFFSEFSTYFVDSTGSHYIIDSAYVGNGNGGVWEGKILNQPVSSQMGYSYYSDQYSDTLDFTH